MTFDPSNLPKGFAEEWERRKAFYKAVREIFGFLNVSYGDFTDHFGGELFYAYYYPVNGTDEPYVDRYTRERFANHLELVNKLLPKIKAKRRRSVSNKLSQAIRDLNIEDLAPLFEATGEQWKGKAIEFNDRGDKIERIERKELIGGAIRRTPLKQLKPGRPPRVKSASAKRKEKAEFEQSIKEAVHGLISSGMKVTKTNVAKFLNCGGEDTRLSAFNAKLKRRGITKTRYEKIVADAIRQVHA